MESQIWRVQTERIGSLAPFKTERDMESFLMNNPAIVGCWDPESDMALPALIRQQMFTVTEKGGSGRIDLVGISVKDSDFELRVFELKAFDIDSAAVEQLNSYLKGWDKEKSAKSTIKNWIMSLNLEGIDEKNIDKIIENPVGVLVGPRFQPEAISKAIELNIQGIRLARFRSETKSEYFVIVEDQVGKIVESGRKQTWSWNDLIGKNLIDPTDVFSISHGSVRLFAQPDTKYLETTTKRVLFDEASAAKILDKEADIRNNAKGYDLKWYKKALASLERREGVFISNATGLFYLAFGGPMASYWVPTNWWIHVKSGKTLEELKCKLFDLGK